MLTYQIRKRLFVTDEGKELKFPSRVEVTFLFDPLQPFGMEKGNGRTAVRAVEAVMKFNANTGHHHVQSKKPLKPVKVSIDDGPTRKVRLIGNKLTVSDEFENLDSLSKFIETIYYILPIMLSVQFCDPVVIRKVEGRIGETGFRWELRGWAMQIEMTTQEEQEKKVAQTWNRFNSISLPEARRLAAALHYFHVASRLARVGNTPWEFMSEILLNFNKILEVLFGSSRDTVRHALREFGFEDSQIEKDFIPAMALRNEIDVGHVKLAVFKPSQLKVLQLYTESAEWAFKELLRRISVRVQAGVYSLEPYSDLKPSRAAVGVIEKLSEHFEDADSK